MGSCFSFGKGADSPAYTFHAIQAKYASLEEVQRGMRAAGLESSNLILGIDFTKSNTWTGERSFKGKSLHHIDPAGAPNPYQRVIDIVARTLEPFDDDKLIPAYGFGDVTTTDKAIFPFFPDERPCQGVAEVLARYNEITPHVNMSGPTSFVPLINKAIEIVQRTKQYHILVIIADGQVTNEKSTADAIIQASKFPISIVMVGVGDGPWDMMKEFDTKLPARSFDNFKFVNFTALLEKPRVENFDVEFAVEALQEIPEQWLAIRKLGLC
jgi:hypothetical protein